ncbi:PAS domain-containing protein [Aquimarina intermedia]|uniref:histidine kinase n=1 Tax=Aquimarina intermedia TaxID=350814 RepID=A0A5S5CC12_9FLAO|nr:PAS domain S-box protein [Aquimarina intermedia]TYP75890.1 PAS domain S-box-containing protein [Aquimarina intermedia]
MIQKKTKRLQVSSYPSRNHLKDELYALVQRDTAIFDFVQDIALDGLWYWDLSTFERIWISSKFWNTLGHFVGHESSSHLLSETSLPITILRQLFENSISHFRTETSPYVEHIDFVHKLGHKVAIECKCIGVFDENNVANRLLVALTDTTKLKQTELRLQRQLDRYQHIIEGANLGVWEWNLQTGEIYFSERWAEIIGYSLLEIEPVSIQTWKNSVHPKDRVKTEKLLKEHIEQSTPVYECEVRMRHKKGHWVWVLARGKVVSYKNDAPEWIIGSHQEITASKNELEKNRLFIEEAPTAIAMFDSKMRYLAVSTKWLEDYSLKNENIIGRSHFAIFPTISQKWKEIFKSALQGETLKSDEDSFLKKNGSLQWLSWELRPWYTHDNNIGGVIMHTADITRAKEAEIKLKISEEAFRGNFENAAVGMAILSIQGQWIEVNQSLCDIVGYTAEELRKLTFQDITHPDDLDKDLSLLEELLAGKRSFYQMEKRYFQKSGKLAHIILSVSLVKDEEDNPLYFISQIMDITPRVKTRKKLSEALQKLENILEDITQVSVIGTDKYGQITTFNKGAENLLGYNRDEMILKRSYIDLHLPEEIQKREIQLSQEYQCSIRGFEIFTILPFRNEIDTREWTHRRSDGTTFPVLVTMTALKQDEEITGYLAIATDIREIKKVENDLKSLLEVTQDQNNRLLNFAHIVSHNLRSHSGNFQMLLDLLTDEHPELVSNEYIGLLCEASGNLNETIHHLNDVVVMNSLEESNMEHINLFEAVRKTIKNIAGMHLESDVRIENNIDTSTQVLGIAAYVESICLNVITNGIKYRAKTRNSFITLNSYVENEFQVLEVRDNGLGIDLEKHRAKMFGMYKTFHDHEKSRGLGLFITKNQIVAMGGTIEVKSEVNVGTVFKIYFKK